MKVIIIGGGAGGPVAATRLRRMAEDTHIILIEKGKYLSQSFCGLPYLISGVIPDRDQLVGENVLEFQLRYNIEVRMEVEASAIDSKNKTVQLRDLETGQTVKESYDKLLLAPGSKRVIPNVPGIDLPGVFSISGITDLDSITTFIQHNRPERAAIVGGGSIGLEVAENLVEIGLETELIEATGQVMPRLDIQMSGIVQKHLKEQGVKLHLETKLARIEKNSKNLSLILENGVTVSADMLIANIGTRPSSELAKSAGLEIGGSGGIKVNKHMCSSDPNIYAIGDAAEVIHLVTGNPWVIPLAGPTNKQARIAADNIAFGNKKEYRGCIGNSITKVFDLTVAACGATAGELRKSGVKYMSAIIHSYSHAGYYPGSHPLTLMAFFRPGDGKLYGAQAVGCGGVDKRIEMLAGVLINEGTIYDLDELEHAYAPPYSMSKDPVNILGSVAENILSSKVKSIDWTDAEKLDRSQFIFLDVRSDEEFSQGSFPGAINIPLNELRPRLEELPRDKSLAVFCDAGGKAYQASRILIQHGFKKVLHLAGGYETFSITCPCRDEA